MPENTSAPTSWRVYDQYGVNLGNSTLTFTGVNGHDYATGERGSSVGSWNTGHTDDTTAYSFDTTTGTFTGVKANGWQNHDMRASFSCNWNNQTKTGNTSWTTLRFPDKYTATYKYYTTKTTTITTSSTDPVNKEYMSVGTATTENTITASSSYQAFYGDAAGVPATSAYTNHYYTSAGHYYNGEFPAPTLTANATKYLSYKNGGSSYATSMASHSWSANWTKYTGTSEGLSGTEFHRKTCTVGGDTHYKYQKHQWNSGVINPDPTCTTKGIKTYTCACGATKTEDVDIVSTNHSWGSWVDYGDDTNHKSVCQYNSAHEKTQAHTYGTTTFAFANDGKSATASRTCTVSTCHHTQSATLTLNNGITSAIKTPAKCTTDGVTTYTATSPFNDGATGTKDVADIPASGHDWDTTTFTFSNDGKSATATRVCKNDNTHRETENATVTPEQIAPSTCTGNGTTRYTAHSPFDDDTATDTKEVGDIAALGHDWNTTVITFAADGKTASATRTCRRDASHVETLAAPVTSAVKTPATCTEKGTTTYTATSPFAEDSALVTATVDKEDIPANGHDWNPVTFEFAADGKTATATRVCRTDGDHVENAAAIMSHEVKTPATCEGDGTTTYTATSPWGDGATDTVDRVDIAAIGHRWGDWEDLGENGHRRVCANDASHIESSATHTYTAYSKDLPEDATILAKLEAEGFNGETQCYRYCTACNNVEIKNHTYTHETTKEPTCTATGVETYTCEYCHTSYTQDIAATGHTWVRWDGCNEEKISELSGAVPVILKCKNGCNKFCSSYYDEKTHKYESTGNAGDYKYVIGQDTASIPTPSFNEHFEYFDGQMEPYHYRERKASLRVRPSEKEDDTQAIRFSGNLTAGNIVDAGVKFNFNPKLIIKNYTEDMPAKDAKLMSLEEIRNNRDAYDDKTVIDFGFVFTQARFIRSAKETIDYDLMTLDNIGTNYRIYRMSVVGNNLDNFRDDKTIENWKGLTMIGEEATFNLVIDVNKKNYQATYVARTYVIYKYHGDIICVYDQPYENYEWDNEKGENVPNHYYSHDSVYNQAHKVLTLTEPTDFVKSYLEDKIINNTATQNFVDWNVNYTLKDFPKVEED